MAGFVVRRNGCAWSSANWVFWGFMDHLIAALADDTAAVQRMEQCKWMQMFSVPIMEEENAAATAGILDVARAVAHRCADGELRCSVDGMVLDEASQGQFREAMRMLVESFLG